MMAELDEREPPSAFRQQALEYITAPKPLDDLVRIPWPLTWVSVLALCLLFTAIILWLCLGSIATYADGKGLLLTDREAVVYVSALAGQRLQPGMNIQVGPNTARSWEYRRIPGKVMTVENFPATPSSMLELLKNPSLVNYFMQTGPVITVKAELIRSPDSKQGEALAPGSLVEVRIITHRQSPISLLLSS